MTIPPRFLDEIRNRLTLSDVIGKKVRVMRAGREFKACCPFHKEKSPSFTINDDKQFYYCFGCGAKGDVIGFVMQHDNLSFIDAVEGLAAEAGLQMPQPDPADIKRAEKTRDLHALLDIAARWMEEQLLMSKNADVLNYLTGRGLQAETLSSFRVGYAPADRQVLRSYLKSEGFTDQQMGEAGLVKTGESGGQPYAFFRDRVMFPVTDRRGRIIAFGGRVLPEHLRPQEGDYKPAKYINSSETPLFDKGRTLYAESKARQAARENKPIILTEGYMDVIACHQAGFSGAVAPMGTALTEEQVMLMWSMITEDDKAPILCFDGDNAGRKAASRACERVLPLLKPSHSVRFAFMPEGQDPDSLIKASGGQALHSVLDSAMSLFDFIWASATAGKDFSNPETRAGLSKSLNEEIKQIADRDVQRHYQSLMNEKISETFFKRRDFGAQRGQGRDRGSFPPKLSPIRPHKPVFKDIHARALLAAVINHPSIFESIEEPLGHLELADPGLMRLQGAVISALSSDPTLDASQLNSHLSEAGFEKEMHDILSESLYVHAAFAAPRADSGIVAARWMEFWRDLQGRAMQGEIKAGWNSVANEDDEEKLKSLLQIKIRDNA